MQAVPSYTAVAARQTLQRPPAVEQPRPARKIEWSPAVRAYVQRAFEQANEIRGIDGPAMQERLKLIISQAADQGLLDQIDWTTYPLPQHFILQDRNEGASSGARSAMITNHTAPPPPKLATFDGASSPYYAEDYDGNKNGMHHDGYGNSKKRRYPTSSSDTVEGGNVSPRHHPGTGQAGLESRITRSKPQEKKQKKDDAGRMTAANPFRKDRDAVEKRLQRFGAVIPDGSSPLVSSRDESPVPLAGPVIGTCQTLEKKYFRLTDPPHPNTVRPLPVLEQALDLVRKKWKKDHNYDYACDQLKSLRQDLTVQHIKNEFTVKVYEVHARIALEEADLGEYNQCQTQLRVLYKLNLGGKPDEFTAYRILYFIFMRNRSGMNDVLADLTPADKQKPGVRHALQVRSALASGNYHKFFRLYIEAPFMGPYLLDKFVERERLAAMAAICKTYKPDVSIHFLANELAFHGEEDADPSDADAGPRQCLDFLCQHGGEHLVERKNDDVRFQAGKAGFLFENARAAAVRSIDIKGQK